MHLLGRPEKKMQNPKPISTGPRRALIASGVILLAIVAVSWFILDSHHRKRLLECKTNLKDLGTAMEMYSTDYDGHYPSQLQMLTPNYLAELPSCPNSDGQYQLKTLPDAPGNDSGFEDYYYIFCAGQNHQAAGEGKDQPAYGQSALPRER